jgi:hypothetical protein
MPELILLDEALEGILDAIVAALKEATKEDGLLEGVQTIVRGDRARPNPDQPAIWVYAMPADPDHSQRSYAELFKMDVALLAIVKDSEPEDGYKAANKFAARARSVVLKDRSLGKRKYVQDVRSGRYEPSGPTMQKDTLFAALAFVQVHFLILENNP